MNSRRQGEKQRQRVLLVEDDQAVRLSLRFLLRSRGYEVQDYASATELLADPSIAQGACLVTDYVMPGVDGLQLLRQLRQSGWTRPAILISGRYSSTLAGRADEAGFATLLEKPLTEQTFLRAVGDAVGQDSIQPLGRAPN